MLQLDAVQSSNVAAAGYLESDQVLLVRFHDGTLYARTGVDAATAAAFEAASSKGAFLHTLQNPSVKIAAGNQPKGATLKTDDQSQQEGEARPTASPLQTYQDDDCCGRGLLKFLKTPAALQATSWNCPKCDCEWNHRMHGEVRHWFPLVATFVMKPRHL